MKLLTYFDIEKYILFWRRRLIFFTYFYKIWKNIMKFNFFDYKIIVFHDFITEYTIKTYKITWNFTLRGVLFSTF